MTTGSVLRYVIVLKPTMFDDESGYTVTVPALPGCVTEGDTIEEAISNAREAISVYLESLRSHGLPVPSADELVTSVEVGAEP